MFRQALRRSPLDNMTPSEVKSPLIQPHLFLKIVVDKTLKRVQGDAAIHRFQVSFDSALNDETTGDDGPFSYQSIKKRRFLISGLALHLLND